MNCRSWEMSPPQLRRGGCAIKKMQRSNRNSRRRGGVDQVRLNSLDQHHPVRSNNVAAQLFLCVAATPPQLRRGYPADLQFIHTFIVSCNSGSRNISWHIRLASQTANSAIIDESFVTRISDTDNRPPIQSESHFFTASNDVGQQSQRGWESDYSPIHSCSDRSS